MTWVCAWGVPNCWICPRPRQEREPLKCDTPYWEDVFWPKKAEAAKPNISFFELMRAAWKGTLSLAPAAPAPAPDVIILPPPTPTAPPAKAHPVPPTLTLGHDVRIDVNFTRGKEKMRSAR
jgi:hypothetical protein